MAKAGKKGDGDGDEEGIFSGNMARLGGIRALADKLKQALPVVFLGACFDD